MKSFEWKVNYVIEGVLPSKLPKSINKECILEEITKEIGKETGEKGETRGILSVRISRQSVPSHEEFEEVRRIAFERVKRLVAIYSLFLARLRIVFELSIQQVTPYKGLKLFSQTFRLVRGISLPDEIWYERIKLLQEVETQRFREYLSLALSHYNLAFWTEPKSSFLNLMICIEALYNDHPQEIRYRISHRIAHLLGRTENLRRDIFNDVQDLYSKRNNLVHGRKPVEISKEDEELLRTYSKYSIRAFLKLKQEKNKILPRIDKAIYDKKIRKEVQEQIENILDSLEKELKKRTRP
jgi:hypothetical protein